MGDRMILLVKLRNIFREIFDDETMKISEDTDRTDIEDWDSVAQVKLVLSIEEVFEIRLSTAEVATIKSVGDFIRAIDKHIGVL